jgi:opacity protein-like surface antigen
MNTRTIFLGTALAAALSGPALAQTNENTVSTSAAVPVKPTGFGLQLGGGVTGFSRQDARDRFGTGGYWDVRGILGTDSYLGAELAYVGSARDANASGLTGNAALLANGAEAVARANLPLQAGSVRVEPFLFGGVGWTYYSIVNSDSNASSIKDNANAFVVPFGAGLSATYDHLMLDARFTYRAVFDDDLVARGNGDSLDLQNWAVGLTLGYQL